MTPRRRSRPGRLRTVAAAAAVLGTGLALGCTPGTWSGPDPAGGPAAEVPVREFAIASDPWQVDDWAEAVGARPTMVMAFEHWHRDRTLDRHFAEAHRRGLSSFMITWEPWVPVPAELGQDAQFELQPAYSNAAIAAGEQDDYIRSFAASVAASGLTVYLRHAHEMNGDWYPWSREPDEFVQAWRRIVDIFREEGATNAQFIFAPNPSLFLPADRWQEVTEPYWPGDAYVDLLGTTMISFGRDKDYSVAEFADRLELMRDVLGKRDVMISELNVSYAARVEWLAELRTWLATEADWVIGVVLSQGDSRGQVQLGSEVGDLSWNVATDPETQPVVRGIVADLTGVQPPADPRPAPTLP